MDPTENSKMKNSFYKKICGTMWTEAGEREREREREREGKRERERERELDREI